MRRVRARIKADRKGLAFAVIVSLAFVGTIGVAVHNIDDAYLASRFNLVSYVPDRILSGSEATVLVIAYDRNGNAKADEPVQVRLEAGERSSIVWTGRTDSEGSAAASFTAPSWSDKARIVVSSGIEEVETGTVIDDTIRIFISTDKPIYQPGQIMHIRVLSFAGSNPLPLDAPLVLEVVDPNGDKIFKKQLSPNEFGVSSYDLALSDQMIQGTYTLKTYCGERSSTKAVMVKEYVLPKFRVDMMGLEDWYLIDEPIPVYLSAEYFFGQPVQGTYEAEASVYYGVWTPVFNISGVLVGGEASFTVPKVKYAIGITAAGGSGYLQLNVSIKDTGGHVEERSRVVSIAEKPLVLSMLTDSCVWGQESVFYAIARTPDGSPIQSAAVSARLCEDGLVVDQLGTVYTDSRGLAELSFTYQGQTSMEVTAKWGLDEYLLKPTVVSVPIEGGTGLKVLSDKSSYGLGEEGVFEVVYVGSSMTSNIYYDVVSRGYVVDRGVLQLDDGAASLTIPMTPDMEPFAQVRVYKIETDMDVVRDAVTFGVGSSDLLSVSVQANQSSYTPRDPVTVSLEVAEKSEPVVAALGVSIVDEAVYEVGSMMVGFEELIFGLDEQFVVPQYQVLSYVYAGAPSLPSDSLSVMPELDEARVSSTWSLDCAAAAQLRDDAIEAYWSALLFSFGLLAVGGVVWAARSGWSGLWILALLFMVPLMLLSALLVYAGQLGTGGSEYSDSEGKSPAGGLMPTGPGSGGIEWDVPSDDDEDVDYTDKGGEKPTVVRNYFPETWYWNPCLLTDEAGKADVQLTAPDSITSWRVDVMASTMDGLLGSGNGSVLVFQPFFIDPDIPVSVVRNDVFPLGVQIYNYLNTEQEVSITLAEEPWFELVSPSTQTVTVPADYVSSVDFTIRASKVGWHTISLEAQAGAVSDAIVKPMKVVPDGMKHETLFNGQVTNGTVQKTLTLDPTRIEGSENAWVKLQGGVEAVLLEGVEAFIRFVTGCGEQSLSMLSIDILAYDTVMKTGSSPERLFEYETVVNQGIQHELMYLVESANGIGRGIVWFPGNEDVHPWLTSWGLIAFQDAVNAGFGLDEKIISDMQAWLLSMQNDDGSWEFPDWGIYEFNNPILKAKKIASTAYIARALMYSGLSPSHDSIDHAVAYVQGHINDVWNDPYSLALSLIVLQQGSVSSTMRTSIAERIDELKVEENGTYYWTSGTNMISDSGFGVEMMPDMWGGFSSAHVIETTGYAAIALFGEGAYKSVVDGAVKYLLDHRQSLGGWFSTQDTIVAFHALNTVSGSSTIEEVTATVSVGGTEVFSVDMGDFNRDVTYHVDVRPHLENVTDISISCTGSGTILYSIYLEQYVPWPDALTSSEYLTLEVTYDATHIALTDSVSAHLYLLYNGSAPSLKMILVDLRAPMGLLFVPSEFDALRDADVIASYDRNDRQMVVYLTDVASGVPVEFDYTLVPELIIKSTVQDICAWDMYDPNSMRAEVEPEEFEVY